MGILSQIRNQMGAQGPLQRMMEQALKNANGSDTQPGANEGNPLDTPEPKGPVGGLLGGVLGQLDRPAGQNPLDPVDRLPDVFDGPLNRLPKPGELPKGGGNDIDIIPRPPGGLFPRPKIEFPSNPGFRLPRPGEPGILPSRPKIEFPSNPGFRLPRFPGDPGIQPSGPKIEFPDSPRIKLPTPFSGGSNQINSVG